MIRRSPPIAVIGVIGGHGLSKAAEADLDAADIVIGSARLLDLVGPVRGVTRPLPPVDELARVIAGAKKQRVAVLASGDPGFFGIVRLLATHFGRDRLRVHPVPSSVALAFARLGLPWDDAVVVSAHGRPPHEAVAALVDTRTQKAAVLTAPDAPPELLANALRSAGLWFAHAAVCTALGTDAESVVTTDLDGVARSQWDGMSVLVLWNGDGIAPSPVLRFGRPAQDFVHRDGMITKDEVRALVLSKLDLPAAGVLWDLGAGSGSVGIEAACLAPGLDVYAVERSFADVERIRANATAFGARLTVVEGDAEQVLRSLPSPDRVFVGGGGPGVIDAALDRLQPGGRIVAASATLQTALGAYQRLGELIEITVNRAVPIGHAGVRLAASNPVFVSWGPR